MGFPEIDKARFEYERLHAAIRNLRDEIEQNERQLDQMKDRQRELEQAYPALKQQTASTADGEA